MQIFITGTDTNIGKTLVSSWLCAHSKYDYFKPIQTGACKESDSQMVSKLVPSIKVYKESYCFRHPSSPHHAASLENKIIDIDKIILPDSNNLIIEGAGGVMVPINQNIFMIDVIQRLNLPVILVANSKLGTINHSLLTLEALRIRDIKILGVIISGEPNEYNSKAIKSYGKIPIIAELPYLYKIDSDVIKQILPPLALKQILKNNG